MNISYIVNPTTINQAEWEKCFEQLVKIAHYYPLTLMRLKANERLGVKQLCWTKDTVYNENGTDALELKGEFYTLEYGSTFTIYKQAVKYIKTGEEEKADYTQNAFWLNPKGEYFNCRHGYEPFDLFKNYDTCGVPYTYAVLAIGIYLEHCFYNQSYLSGDFNAKQVRLVMEWLEDLLNEKVKLPKSLHQQKLWNKLHAAFNDPVHTITRFWFLSVRSAADKIGFLLTQDKKNTDVFLVAKVRGFTSVHQWGVIDVLMPYLEAVGDLEAFILFFKEVQEVNKFEAFSLEELLRMLLREGVCDKPFDNYALEKYNEERATLETGMEGLNRMLFKMGGMPGSRKFYATPEELLEIFAYYKPINAPLFSEIINNEVKQTAEKRKDANKKLEDALEQVAENDNHEEKPEENGVIRYHLANEDYFIEEARAQKKRRSSEEVVKFVATDISRKLHDFEQKHSQGYFNYTSATELQQQLYKEILERGMVVTENTCIAIDSLQDITILEGLLYLASIKEREMKFWNLRMNFFESPQFWHYFKSV